MNPTTARELEQAVAAMISALRPAVEADWTLPAENLEWSCWQTAAHVAHDLLAYACRSKVYGVVTHSGCLRRAFPTGAVGKRASVGLSAADRGGPPAQSPTGSGQPGT